MCPGSARRPISSPEARTATFLRSAEKIFGSGLYKNEKNEKKGVVLHLRAHDEAHSTYNQPSIMLRTDFIHFSSRSIILHVPVIGQNLKDQCWGSTVSRPRPQYRRNRGKQRTETQGSRQRWTRYCRPP